MKTRNNSCFQKLLLASAISAISFGTQADFTDANSDYSTAPQQYHVWNEALQPVDLVNKILCFTGQLKANEFINKGPYIALADEVACFGDESGGGDSAQSSGASNIPSYTKIIVDATRETVNDPLIVKVWIPAMGQGDEVETIKFKSSITEGASEENPFGSFTFNYDFFDGIESTTSLGGGEIKTLDIPNKIGFTFYENEPQEPGRVSKKGASVVMNADRTEGIAFTFNHQSDSNMNISQGNYFGLSFNESNVLLQTADTYENLPFNSNQNTGDEACLSRTEFNESVWRYNLFDTQTGGKIALNSGLSFKFDSDNNSQPDSYGHIGYWGLWTESGHELNTDDTIYAESHTGDELVQTPYTVLKAPGRLIKNTVEQLPLDDIQGVQFNYFSPDAQQSNFQSWVVNYLTTADDGVENDGFYKTGGNINGEDGPQLSELPDPIAITLGDSETLNMHSEQLGGPVKYQNNDSFITFARQEYINGSETGEGELLASGSLQLYCVDRCPVGTLDGSDLSDWSAPYSTPVLSLENAIEYNFSVDGDNALTLVRESNSERVEYASNLTTESLQQNNSPYSWGIRSGSLVTSAILATLDSPRDIYNPAKVLVFYEWETGLNAHNKMVSVKDSEGKIVTFDKPIQFTYTHTDAKDRSDDAGNFDGKTVLLNYGGNGQLWGIPSTQNENGRMNAAFTIKDGTQMGPDNQYVIKAEQIEGTMKPTPSQCSNLALAEPAAPVPTSTSTSAGDIGEMPVVTDAPAVIAGVVQTVTP